MLRCGNIFIITGLVCSLLAVTSAMLLPPCTLCCQGESAAQALSIHHDRSLDKWMDGLLVGKSYTESWVKFKTKALKLGPCSATQ